MVKMEKSAKALGGTGSQANETGQAGWYGVHTSRPKSLNVTPWAGVAPEGTLCII